ncbi:MAG: 2'-5' RNA ligase family protein [Salinimicrobium sp.]
MPLYFIALLPPEELLEEIKHLKEEIKQRFGPKHALKLPAHITLQIPFHKPKEQEPILEESLLNFSRNEEEIEVDIDGYAAFMPRVLYLHIKEPQPIIELHERLQEMLVNNIGLQEKEQVKRLHPHITLATRDIKKEVFKALWKEFKELDFKAGFVAEELLVFRHDGKVWEQWRKFKLG